MQRYEHERISVPSGDSDVLLEKMEKDGWEVATCYVHSVWRGSAEIMWVFKRPIETKDSTRVLEPTPPPLTQRRQGGGGGGMGG